MKRLAPILILLLALGGLAYLLRDRWALGQAEDLIQASGTIEAEELRVAAELGGRVRDVAVEEGDTVEEGQVLATLDPSLLEAQLRQARAALDLARAMLGSGAAGATGTTRSTGSAASSGSAGSTGSSALLAAGGSAAARVAAAQLAQAEAQVALLEAQLERLTLRAPRGGVVLQRLVSPGELAQPGAPLLVLGLLDDLKITVYVPEDRYGRIDLGDEADVTADAFPDRVFEAEVSRIADRAEFTPRNVQTVAGRKATVFAITLALKGKGSRLKPGMPADLVFRDSRP